MNSPGNIVNLAEKNQAILDRLNFDPAVDDPYELCTLAAYNQTGIFTPEMVSEIFGLKRQDNIYRPDVANHIGMVLVRPDMVHASKQFEDYLGKLFKIETSEQIELTAEAYWNIYRHDLYRLETMHSRLTRAVIYIGSPSRLIMFSDQEHRRNEHLADHSKNVLRGHQGIYSPNTLRGDLVYRNAIKLGAHLLDDTVDKHVKTALDPFGAYRRLVTQNSGDHVGLAYPLLFYTGVGVHVPNSSEIKSDLPEALSLISARVAETK